MSSSLFSKSLSWAPFFKKSSSWDPTWNAGVLIVSRLVLAVNPSVQGYFIYVCVLYFKGRVYNFLSFKTVSSRIIGHLSPVKWGTHGSEVPLTIFFIIFKFIPVSFFLVSSFIFLPANPIGSFYDYGQAMIHDMSAWKSPIELRLTKKWSS